jgi:hypothetical protein
MISLGISLRILGAAILAASAGGTAPTGKLAPAVSKEMTEAIVAVNKALGLESWPAHGAQPCVDRGGQGITAKDVTPDEARKCAAASIEKGFPELGKSYVIAVPMASIGPATVIAVGLGDSAGWGAYSCDPERKCNPVKLSLSAKWSKRTAERLAKSCAEPTTLWFPTDAGPRACGAAGATASAPPAAAGAPTTPPPAGAPTTPPPASAPPADASKTPPAPAKSK